MEYGVDAFYKCAPAEVGPVEYAVLRSYDVEEALAVLKEFVQIPDQVKFEKLWRLMRFGASENSQQDFEEMLRSMPVDLVSRTSVGDERGGTLLQIAMKHKKEEFIRLLLEFGVDPTVYSDVDENTPLEIALGHEEHRDLLFVLDEFMELPNEAKLVQLSLIVDSDPEEDWHRDRFSKILKSLPLDLVNTDSTSVRVGTILQKAVQQGKLLLVQDLLEQGVDPTATCKEIRESPMELSKRSSTEMRRLLSKFTEMPEHIKLHHLSELMSNKEDKDKDKDNVREEFKEIL